MKKWSKLKRDLENLMDPNLKFKIYANAYENGDRTGQPLCRFWITIKGQIVWDYPRDFMSIENASTYYTNNISQHLRDYINTPINKVLEVTDKYNLYKLLYTCDRRVGKRKLEKLSEYPEIIKERL